VKGEGLMTRRIFAGPLTSVTGFEVGIGDERVEVIDSSGNLSMLSAVTTETTTTLSTAIDIATGQWRLYLTSAGELCTLSTAGVTVLSTA
jgi:hypothetical protein